MSRWPGALIPDASQIFPRTFWCWHIIFLGGWRLVLFFWGGMRIYQASNLPCKSQDEHFITTQEWQGDDPGEAKTDQVDDTPPKFNHETWTSLIGTGKTSSIHPPFLRFHVHFRFLFAQLWMALAKKMYVIFCGSTVMGIGERQFFSPPKLLVFNDKKKLYAMFHFFS